MKVFFDPILNKLRRDDYSQAVAYFNSLGIYAVTTVANYSALPNVSAVAGHTYIVLSSQGTAWLPGAWGGTYYPDGFYYSDGSSWYYTKTPYQATQTTVNIGTDNSQFITSLTLTNANVITNKELTSNKSITTADSASNIKFPVWSAVVSYVTGLGYLLASTASSTYQTIITYTSWGTFLHASTNKINPIDADEIGIWDSVSGLLNKVSLINLKTYLVGYFTSYQIITITSNATPTIATGTFRETFVAITALATAITSFTTNLSGTPANGARMTIRIKDNGTARALTFGSSFEACGASLPTTTTISKRTTIGFVYDTTTSKWGCVASVTEA
jgi:hypothetical protein